MKLKVGVIYKITYPNGKLYIGQDRTDDINYFGSADSFTIAADFAMCERDYFCIFKQILDRVENITIKELNALEKKRIAEFRSDDPIHGYNRTGVSRRKCKTIFSEDESK